jgi:predicted DNA-binding WGR domain protein
MRRFEFVDGTSNKFWEAKTEGPKLMVRFGRIGGTWQESDKLLADAEKANAEMEKLIREKTRKGYLEVGGKPEVKVLAKAVAKKAKTKEPKPQSMEATISPAERKAKAQKVLLMFANGQWELAHNILETAQDEKWLFEQLLNGCKIEKGKPIPSNAIKKAFKKDEKSSLVLAMLNIMLCNPRSTKTLKSFKFEKLKGLDFGAVECEEMPPWFVHVLRLIPMSEILVEPKFLKRLSDSAAEALGKCKGDLYLGELKSLSDAAAEALSKHKGQLNLRGLTSLSTVAAEALSRHKGDLLLWGLKSLSNGTAEALSKHEDLLELGGLKSLSDGTAEILSRHKGKKLELWGLTSLSDAAAESLSKHKGELNLSELTSLSDSSGHVALAGKLASQKGEWEWELDLRGLTSLSDAAAEALSKHKGRLNLSGLTSLSDAAAEALSKHKGDISFYNLKISDELHNPKGAPGYVALALSLIRSGISFARCDYYDMGKWSLQDTPAHINLAKGISMLKGYLELKELVNLSDAAAEILSKHKGVLRLEGLANLSDAAAEALSKHEGDLDLNGLESLSDAAAKSLSKHKGYLVLSGSIKQKVEKYKKQSGKK